MAYQINVACFGSGLGSVSALSALKKTFGRGRAEPAPLMRPEPEPEPLMRPEPAPLMRLEPEPEPLMRA